MSDFKAKCTKFDFHWGSTPEPAGGAYSSPQTHRGLLLRGMEGERGRGRKREGKGKGG